MSSARPSALHRWSPLHPPLARFAPAQAPEVVAPDDADRGGRASVVDPREGRPSPTPVDAG
ncbi:hypothetical protein [Quadrisphaera sp. INWT6]|uniref:hypothetical protein n=1 Tax=Quadrisphaera sp. INWT6 TaxID=2596917 RepID=UPI0018923001|nr:hypothetical protein [Quadrisphaera sp. INWT6]MBF5081216.1 hypothetical protein [Quadrisphaera sp. INWT6]